MEIRLRIIALLLVFGLAVSPVWAQGQVVRFVKKILNDTSSAATSKLIVFPTLGFAPETSLEVGIRTFSLFYVKGDTVVNRLSEINLNTFVTLKGQFGALLENAVYTDQNTYFFLGKARYQQFPLLYYGIGPATSKSNPVLVNSVYFQIRQRILRKIRNNWYTGAEADFQSIQRVSFESEETSNFELPVGGRGSKTTGLGLALVYDDRKNVLNVRKGQFLETGILWYQPGFGSDFKYQSVVLDGRLYRPLGRPNRVLAMQLAGTFITGDVPFNNLGLIGGESLMRGYYLGRYRDKNVLATQAEIRWLPFGFSKRWGGSLFAGLGTVAPSVASVQLNHVRWAAGGGVRFLFFQKKDVFLRADLGVTREGTGFYISLGEAF
ncbi:BamA/TamA family outer membrane protein [Larkinella terrae]|uniref:BamA/TamA family outer membrane protein n=1 Tax=Larkinella terrae TaxID=2025311 RepID=A0A7K0EKR0_9BACT|nr:BamA/TamA family outer membrane protein [Larkinella terrae]MRS62365.1 BamA/TamA family outer membrane protein [Larkinella terrae]